MGPKNPNKTPLIKPQTSVLVSDYEMDNYELNLPGTFLAYQPPEINNQEQSVKVIDPVTGELIDQVVVGSRDSTGAYMGFLGWDSQGDFWANTYHINHLDGCETSYVFEPQSRKLRTADCKERPQELLSDRPRHTLLYRDKLPANAEMPQRTRFVNENPPFARQNPSTAVYAVKVNEREYKARIGVFQIFDTRLLDKDGKFIAQLGSMTPVGWAYDGSLIVHAMPADPGNDSAPISRITAEEIERIVNLD